MKKVNINLMFEIGVSLLGNKTAEGFEPPPSRLRLV